MVSLYVLSGTNFAVAVGVNVGFVVTDGDVGFVTTGADLVLLKLRDGALGATSLLADAIDSFIPRPVSIPSTA